MKKLFSLFKFFLLTVLKLFSFLTSLYFSIIFFLVLMVNEAINGKADEMLKEDFSDFIQKISEFPESVFTYLEKQEMDWSKR
jgi:hypothetical protein